MKKAIAALQLNFLAIMAVLPLGAANVRGTVRDIYNQPLPGIQVRIGEGGQAIETDERGAFSFHAGEDGSPVQLLFESPRYHQEKRLIVPKGATISMKVFLIPIRLLKEDVTVTALNHAEKAVYTPFAQNVVANEVIRESQPETIVQAIQSTPGVHFIGKGGVAVTPSIRGLARRRILLLAGGARITSDRSAGASAHFFPPEMVQRIEVVRSAASVIYGSDAIGGVIQVIPRDARDPEAGLSTLNISGSSADQRINGGISLNKKLGAFSLMAAMQLSRAGDYSAAGERILNSGFQYCSGRLAAVYETAARGFSLSFLKSAGRDVGKPERANDPAVASFYPAENTNLLNFSYHESGWVANGTLHLSFFLIPNDYELNKVKQAGRQVDISRNSALDFGLRASLKKKLHERLSYQLGLDYFGRANVDMENETLKNDVVSSRSFPVENGRRNDLGAYATLTFSGPAGLGLTAGARVGAFSRSAISDGVFMERSSLAPAFFLGATGRIGESLTLFANAGTAFRLPSLSEAFYTGITGRSSIVGNPDLQPEKSLNLDAGMRIHLQNLFLAASLFQYAIRDMIEKFPLSDTAYTYDNIERGRIRGLELEFQFQPLQKLEIFGNGFYYHGASTPSGEYLNDVPSAKLFLGAKFWLGRFWSGVNWLGSAAVRHPGPAEVVVPAYTVTDLKAGYYFSNRVILFAKISNLFDHAYYANADPDIPMAKGLDFSLGMNINL